MIFQRLPDHRGPRPVAFAGRCWICPIGISLLDSIPSGTFDIWHANGNDVEDIFDRFFSVGRDVYAFRHGRLAQVIPG